MNLEHAALRAQEWRYALPFRAALVALLVVVAAAWPRVVSLGQLVTVDEVNFWYRRTNAYDRALRAGAYEGTLQSGHPGATTMGLATLGLRLPIPSDSAAPTPYLARMSRARFPAALLGAFSIGFGYLALRRLFAPPLALLAATLWAGDLLLLGHSRLLHLDALLTSFVTLCVLLLLGVTNTATPRGPAVAAPTVWLAEPWWLVGAGVCAGLGLITKSPAVILLPFAAIVLAIGTPAGPRGSRLVARYALFGASAALTMVLCWPAMWVIPLTALRSMVAEVVSDGLEPHATGNFFLGRFVDDPGPLFYPLVLLFRLSPLTLLGLALLPLAARRRFPGLLASRRSLLLLGLFAIGFMLMMSLSAKKFDRYLLPVFPTLDILGAVGLFSLFGTRRSLVVPAVSLLTVLVAASVWWYHPYTLAYFNPLLGGGPVAQQVFLVGWGEGLEQASAFLDREPQIDGKAVASSSVAVLRASAQHFSVVDVGGSLDPLPHDYPNYLVLYSSTIQRGVGDPGAAWLLHNAQPLHVVTIHGLEYARIYQIPPSVPTERPADFGTAIHLRGYSVTPLGEPGLRVGLFWEARGATAGDALTFVHLLGPDGRRYAQVDLAPGGAALPTSAWTPGRFLITDLALQLPPEAPPGRYSVVAGRYDAASGQRLPLSGAPPADPSLAGPDALLLATVELSGGQ